MTFLKPVSCIMLVATLAVLIGSSTASAEEGGNPLILPEPTALSPLRFTSKTLTKVVFTNGGLTIECKDGTSSGEFTSKRAGTVTISANTCISIAHTSCTSPGATKGTITFSGASIHLVAFKLSGTLRLGAVIKLPGELLIGCETGSFLWGGSVMGLYEVPLEILVKTATLAFNTTGEAQELTECDLDKEYCFEGSTHKKFFLQTFSLAQAMQRKDPVTFEKEAKFMF
jgi:hypothetical protein